jgi:hypothetical protein
MSFAITVTLLARVCLAPDVWRMRHTPRGIRRAPAPLGKIGHIFGTMPGTETWSYGPWS